MKRSECTVESMAKVGFSATNKTTLKEVVKAISNGAKTELTDAGYGYENLVIDGVVCAKRERPNHGEVVKTRFEPFYDVTVYEDGFEDRFYIGD